MTKVFLHICFLAVLICGLVSACAIDEDSQSLASGPYDVKISGVVLNKETDLPVKGIQVSLYAYSVIDSDHAFPLGLTKTQTDDHGVFRISYHEANERAMYYVLRADDIAPDDRIDYESAQMDLYFYTDSPSYDAAAKLYDISGIIIKISSK